MAGAACKVVINSIMLALAKALEEILLSPLVRDAMLPATKCDQYLDEMFRLDLITYNPGLEVGRQQPYRGLGHILADLVDAGVVVPSIWQILVKPV